MNSTKFLSVGMIFPHVFGKSLQNPLSFFWHLNLFASAVLNPTKVLFKYLASACYNLKSKSLYLRENSLGVFSFGFM